MLRNESPEMNAWTANSRTCICVGIVFTFCDYQCISSQHFIPFFLKKTKQALERVSLGQGVSKECILTVINIIYHLPLHYHYLAPIKTTPSYSFPNHKHGGSRSLKKELLSQSISRMHSNNQAINSTIVLSPPLFYSVFICNTERRAPGQSLTYDTRSHWIWKVYKY